MSQGQVAAAEGFLLSRQWRQGANGIDLTFWMASDNGPIEVIVTGQEAVTFVHRETTVEAPRRQPLSLRSLQGRDVDALYFRSQREMIAARDSLRMSFRPTFESDVKPHDRFLMERFVTASLMVEGPARFERGVLTFVNPHVRAASAATPKLRALSLDLETDDLDGPILAAAFVCDDVEECIVVRAGSRDDTTVTFVPDEMRLLEALFARIAELDPDVIIGWNVVEFDLRVLEARSALHNVSFAIGRKQARARMLVSEGAQPTLANIPGRVALDGVAVMKSATWSFEQWNLDYVASSLLGRHKAIVKTNDPVAEIRRLHREDPAGLAAYNLEDCRLVRDIFAKADLLAFAMKRAQLTGLAVDRQGGSVAAFDHLYLPRLHRRGFVAPDVGETRGPSDELGSPGGYVLDSIPGIHEHVLSFDFRSLYPSIIRTFHIDPLGLALATLEPREDDVPGDSGARYRRDDDGILPSIVAQLHERRNEARQRGDAPLTQAIKILMNSLYGVLGTPGCRIFDARMASSITRRGHELLERSRAWFEARGLSVLYGDTDSLFVRMNTPTDVVAAERYGRELSTELTAFWTDTIQREHGLASFLELRFDAYYARYLMPTMRGSEVGSKKRYAGLVRREGHEDELVIRGLEAVRTDWTPLARRFQRELLTRVLTGRPFEDWTRQTRSDLFAGLLDGELVYRKRLRRELSDYGNAPPHVQAARLLEKSGHRPGRSIEYVMTTRGAQPAAFRDAPFDYAHYSEKQLAPAADVALTLLGTSYGELAGEQLSLF